MGLVTLGVVCIVLSVVLARFHSETSDRINLQPWAWAGRIAAVLLIAVGILSSAITIVPAGHQAVLLRFGAVTGSMKPGIHLIIPYVNSVELMETRTQKESSEAQAASKDLQIVTTSLALNFHVDPSKVAAIYSRVGISYKDRIIDPVVQESIKMVTAKYTAEELIKSRAKVKAEVEDYLTERLREYDVIVEPAGLSITNFNFSPEFNAAIEAKQVAQQDAEKQKYVLERAELEQQTEVTKAKGTAEAAKLKAAALQSQGGSKVLAREWIDKWNGQLPTVTGGQGMIIDINSILKQAQ